MSVPTSVVSDELVTATLDQDEPRFLTAVVKLARVVLFVVAVNEIFTVQALLELQGTHSNVPFPAHVPFRAEPDVQKDGHGEQPLEDST